MKLTLPFGRKHRSLPGWVDYIVLVAICSTYIVICSIHLGGESSYFDEGFTSYLARFSPLEIAHYTALDVHPPLYYIALHYWQQIVGINVFWLRFLSVIFGVIALIFSYLIAKKTFGRYAAWSAVALLTLSPLFVRYSEAMRMYTMAIALVTIATYLLITIAGRKTNSQNRTLWVLYAIAVSAGMWTNYFTAFVWVAHFVWLLSERVTDKSGHFTRLLNAWLVAVAGAIVLYLPWIPSLIVRFSEVQSTGFWIKPISIDTLVSTVTTSLVYSSPQQTRNWLAILVAVLCFTLYFVLRKAYSQLNKEQRKTYRLLAITGVVPIIGLIVLSLPPFRSSYVYRYVLNGIFMLTLLTGISFAIIRFKNDHVTKIIVLGALIFIPLSYGVLTAKESGNRSLDTGVKNMVAQTITAIRSRDYTGEPIISRSPYTYYTASLYETTDSPIYYTYSSYLNRVGSTHMLYDHPQARGIKNLSNFVEQHKKIWILAEDKGSAMTPPVKTWRQTQFFMLRDPVTGVPTSYAAEYAKP